MSLSAKVRAELERRRREQIRLNRVRDQCRSLLESLKEREASMSADEKQALETELQKFRNELVQISNSIQDQPDASLEKLEKYSEDLSRIIVSGEQAAEEWDENLIDWKVKLQETRNKINAMAKSDFKSIRETHEMLLKEISTLDDSSPTMENQDKIRRIENKIGTKYKIVEEEEVRREVIKTLIKVMRDMGFKTSKPKLLEGNNMVKLYGKLPSGRKANFLIHEDGMSEFDFEGYEGKACKDELDQIRLIMDENYNLKTEIEQFSWHNPDKIEKEAKFIPPGSEQRRNQA